MARRQMTHRQAAIKHGWRSGLEDAVGEQLVDLGVDYEYEAITIEWEPSRKLRRYTPDFILPNGIIIETKGRFVTADRQKHIAIKKQHPNLDIRFVFSNPRQRISKQSKTMYYMWCEKHGLAWAAKLVPVKWAREKTNIKSLKAIRRMQGE